ncbi:MAG: Rho-binding antiterminator [Bacteroidota bacterium]
MNQCNLPSDKSNTNGYMPISCGYYDYLEAFAVQKKEVDLSFISPEHPSPLTIQGKVVDLFSRTQVEFMLFQSGDTKHEIRLDHIIEIEGIPNPSAVPAAQ